MNHNRVFAAVRVNEGDGVVRAVVASVVDDFNIGVVCHYESDTGTWEPEFGVDNAQRCRFALPHCYKLDELAVTALDGVLAQKNMAC